MQEDGNHLPGEPGWFGSNEADDEIEIRRLYGEDALDSETSLGMDLVELRETLRRGHDLRLYGSLVGIDHLREQMRLASETGNEVLGHFAVEAYVHAFPEDAITRLNEARERIRKRKEEEQDNRPDN